MCVLANSSSTLRKCDQALRQFLKGFWLDALVPKPFDQARNVHYIFIELAGLVKVHVRSALAFRPYFCWHGGLDFVSKAGRPHDIGAPP